MTFRVVVDDRSFTLKLNEPYGRVLDAMAKSGWALFVMLTRDAAKEPNDPVSTANGSGPFHLLRQEWVHEAGKVAFEKNPAYVPRAEPASTMPAGA